ncbi:MAG: zf-HC2 domain-containing protein [Marmoricola sp.]
MSDHERYADWDAAYVLGSLGRTERAEFETHLAECPRCQAAIGELAPLPGLLSRLEPDEAMALLDEGEPTPAPVRPLPRRRPPVRTAAAVLAAAAVVLLAVLIPTLTRTSSPSVAASISLHQTVSSPLSASVQLTRTSWGTRVDMTCTYAAGYAGTSAAYRLYVLDRNGHAWLVSSWHAGPGDVARTIGSSDLSPADIASVQVRSASGTVLLTGQA